MNSQDQIKAIAELDGWKFDHVDFANRRRWAKLGSLDVVEAELPHYLTSRDAIIPVIEKSWSSRLSGVNFINYLERIRKHSPCCAQHDKLDILLATPQQLAEALLRATGKWIDNE